MMGPSDPLGWAKNPRSREAIAAIRELARKDPRLRAIWHVLVEEGVATDAGTPLKVWHNENWIDL